jgi:thiol-disulfide isomerase/thioredoxin
MKKQFWVGFLVGVLFAIILLLGIGYLLSKMVDGDSHEISIQKTETPEIADFDFKLRDLRTDSVIDNLRFKNKVVLLNFWEHWCIPCIREMPTFHRLYNTVNDTAIVFAFISTEMPDSIKKYTRQYDLPFFHSEKVIPAVFETEIFPRTYLVNRKGEIVIKEFGDRNWSSARIVRIIDSLKLEKY